MTYPKEGASLQEIVRFVMRNTRLSEARARYLIIEVLKAGISRGRIRRVAGNLYALANARPAPLANKITDPNFDDDSSEASTDQDD
ncbi:hypothetical protein KPH14_010350 [Odynerus spinipes]|uniref:Uncharacterized protein n=1 Tax=Odynerus spinipes TaxID=1348599 RepID=A0AAD9VT32_9HYME|nr:hypothetical protein KPH14_010350 [Odynerus spinipes]